MEIPEKGPLQGFAAGERPADEPQDLPQKDPGKAPTSSTGRDTVSLTDKGRELPDVRMDRVRQLKRELAQGTYRVEGSRIAVNIIDESMENDSVLKHIDTKA